MLYSHSIARNYAFCLLENTKSDKERHNVLREISLFRDTFLDSKDLSLTLFSPLVSITDKVEVVTVITEKLKLMPIVKEFFKVIAKNCRFKIVESMVNEYKKLFDQIRGTKVITLEFSVDPSHEIINMLRKYLEKKVKGTIEFVIINNPSLIRGVIIKYDSLLYDCSISGLIRRINTLVKSF